MYKFLKNKRAQSTLEYAILIIIVIGALLTIQVYIKRGVQGRLRQATDDIGQQFKPGSTNYRKTMTTNSKTQESFASGVTRSQMIEADQTTEVYSQNMIDVDNDFWGK